MFSISLSSVSIKLLAQLQLKKIHEIPKEESSLSLRRSWVSPLTRTHWKKIVGLRLIMRDVVMAHLDRQATTWLHSCPPPPQHPPLRLHHPLPPPPRLDPLQLILCQSLKATWKSMRQNPMTTSSSQVRFDQLEREQSLLLQPRPLMKPVQNGSGPGMTRSVWWPC